MWKGREPTLDRETVDGIIRMLMAMDFKLHQIREKLDIEDEEEEKEDDA